jgi:hypothetical protein
MEISIISAVSRFLEQENKKESEKNSIKLL